MPGWLCAPATRPYHGLVRPYFVISTRTTSRPADTSDPIWRRAMSLTARPSYGKRTRRRLCRLATRRQSALLESSSFGDTLLHQEVDMNHRVRLPGQGGNRTL